MAGETIYGKEGKFIEIKTRNNLMLKFFILLIPFLLLADTGSLTKIVDGDTLYFKTNGKKVKCRIEYIDTPESKNNSKLKRDIKHCRGISTKDMISAGKSATRAAKRLLKLGDKYSYKTHGKDRYGRSICVVQLDDTKTFNEVMILDGYAVPFRRYMTSDEKRYYNRVLEKARTQNRGLWKNYSREIECLNSARN